MLSKFERYKLTFGPTPIEKLFRLTAHLGGDVEIFAKREDCNSGLAYGGNKLRKLEYIVPDVIASNADTLVSIGGVQSNHTRMVAAVAAKLGMKRRLIQESWVPHADAVYDGLATSCYRGSWAPELRLVDRELRHRHSRKLNLARWKHEGRAANPTPFRPAHLSINWVASVTQGLPRRSARRKKKWICGSTT